MKHELRIQRELFRETERTRVVFVEVTELLTLNETDNNETLKV